MALGQWRKRITSSTTTTVVPYAVSVKEITIAVANAGTSWTLKVQDQASPPFVLVPATTLALPSTPEPVIITWDTPVQMATGVDVVTSGTAGEVSVWITTDSGAQLPT